VKNWLDTFAVVLAVGIAGAAAMEFLLGK